MGTHNKASSPSSPSRSNVTRTYNSPISPEDWVIPQGGSSFEEPAPLLQGDSGELNWASYGGFDFSNSNQSSSLYLPESITSIDGIVVSITQFNNTASTTPVLLYAALSNATGSGSTESDFSNTKLSQNMTASNSTLTFGSPTQLWGQSGASAWTRAKITSSDFGVAFFTSYGPDQYTVPNVGLSSPSITIYYTDEFGFKGTTELGVVKYGTNTVSKIYKGTSLIHEF